MNTIEIPELSITRKITNIQTINLPNYTDFIKWVNILVTGEDSEGIFGQTNIVHSFDIFNINQTFIPFDELTEETILGWIDAKDNNQDEWSIEYLKKNYVEKKFSTTSLFYEEFPWNI